LRAIILGLGVQGRKRRAIAGPACAGVVDPFSPEADFADVADVPLGDYDAALVCTPDAPKVELLRYLLGNGKHVLVEKPLLSPSGEDLQALAELAASRGATCYTAYNHRFEPHFVRMRQVLEEGLLGRIYTVRMFYGNGTARLVRDSAWRDQEAGVLPDLGSHLLDTLLFWTGKPDAALSLLEARRFENRAPDLCSLAGGGRISIHLEMSLLSWRNHFYADIVGELGSAHIQSLCKWGPSTFTLRRRVLPSGRPDESASTLVQADPTWALEWEHFKTLCRTGRSNIDNDLWINGELQRLAGDVMEGGS
jgi:predicted dehydrogenase